MVMDIVMFMVMFSVRLSNQMARMVMVLIIMDARNTNEPESSFNNKVGVTGPLHKYSVFQAK